VPNLVLVIMDC